MSILNQLNNLKTQLTVLEKDIVELPEEIQEETQNNISQIRDLINRTGATIEKYFQDEKTITLISNTLRRKMDAESIYNDIPKDQKEAIIEKVIEDADINLLTEEKLREYISERLKVLPSDEFITKAYRKKDILSLGSSVTPANASNTVKYEAGLDILRDLVKTPTGREEAVANGTKRGISENTLRNEYIYLYYGLS